MTDNNVTWLHLSDLHTEARDDQQRRRVLQALWDDIRAFRDMGLRPDLVFVTGDVAMTGTWAEYEWAIKEFFDPLLAAAEVPKTRLFVVPGNHDSDWAIVKRLKSPLPDIQDREHLDELIREPRTQRLYTSQLSAYERFIREHLQYGHSLQSLLSYRFSLQLSAHNVAIVGLNSAWLSGFNKQDDKSVVDMGQLAVGSEQLDLVRHDPGSLHIAVMHHPLDWLMGDDRFNVEGALARHCDVLLTGHLHRADILSVSRLTGDLIIVPAGAVFDNRRSPSSYNFVQLDLSTGVGIIFLRHYSERRQEWCKDLDATGDSGDGRALFKLPRMSGGRGSEDQAALHSRDLSNLRFVVTVQARRELELLPLDDDERSLLELATTSSKQLKVYDIRELYIKSSITSEFTSHVSYIIYDLEDYPLPLRSGYIVVLSKIGNVIEIRHVLRASTNEAMLASWSDVLALYRRATRMAYRTEPARVTMIRGAVERTITLHLGLVQSLTRHFLMFQEQALSSDLIRIVHNTGAMSISVRSFAAAGIVDFPGDEIAVTSPMGFHVWQVLRALLEVVEATEDYALGDLTAQAAQSLMVLGLERSLQHIHKIILDFSPLAAVD